MQDFKIYIFGGLNNNLKALKNLYSFDISTYSWENIKTTGE